MDISKNVLIRQKNDLIGRAKNKMSYTELLLYYSILKRINKDDEDFLTMKISVNEFIIDWDKKHKHAYEQVKEAVSGLLDNKIEMEKVIIGKDNTQKRKFHYLPLLKSAKYVEGEGYIEVKINDMLKEFLLQLKAQYTILDIRNIKTFPNTTTFILYELFKKWQNKGFFTADINYMKYLIAWNGNEDNNNFKNRVIKKAVDTINEESDLLVIMTVDGRGKNTKFNFVIKKKWKEKLVDKSNKPQEEEDELFERLWQMYPRKKGKASVSKKKKKELFEVGEEELIRCIERYKAETKGRSIDYVLHGSTFFNGRYVDYLDENYQQEKTDISNPKDDQYERYKDFHTLDDALEYARKIGDI